MLLEGRSVCALIAFVYWDTIWATTWLFPGSSSKCVAISAWQCPSAGLGQGGCYHPSDTEHLSCCRYFQCPPKFGLFAPIHKVIRIGFPSTSPAKAKKSKRMAMGVSALTHSPSSSSISSVSSVASSVGGRPSRSGLVSGFFHSPSAEGLSSARWEGWSSVSAAALGQLLLPCQ